VTEADQAPAAPAARRVAAGDVALLAGGAAATVVVAAAIARKPLPGLALLTVIAFVAAVAIGRSRIARVSLGTLLLAGLLLLPAAALLGPSFALPAAPQLFLYRVLLALVAYFGVAYLIVRRGPLPFAAKDAALPIALWFAWLILGVLWAPDKLTALTYVAVVVTMIAAMAATAAAGGSRRRLRAFGLLMILTYAFIVGFTVLEARFGIRLPVSRLLTAITSQTYAVTSVFHNQNDLATYIAICWPFMLCAFVFTRRPLWLALDVLFMALGAAAFVRTGSRSSLVAAGISTLAAPFLFARLGPRLTTRRGKIVAALVAATLVGGGAYLLFNNSQSDMLRQFRLEALIGQAHKGSGSGEIRASLNSRGFEIAGGTYLRGAGPGQAEGIIGSGTNALSITNLHDWWLETYADGGLVGFVLHMTFFVMLVIALWPIAVHDPDPFLRYLASGTVLALLGFTVGALGPSSSVNFAPMWILYGLGLAVISRARLAAAEERRP
jgi:teichuronic acid biosynthesis protein TuaE